MTDGEAFLLALVVIYLSECLVWLPPSGCALISYGRKRYHVKRAVAFFDALRRGFAVMQPLPPFGTVFVGQAWPVSLSPEGVAPFSRENPNPGPALLPVPGATWKSWESITSIRSEGSTLRIDGHPFADAATPAGARTLAAALEKIRRTPPPDRAALIDRLVRRSLDPRRAARRARFFQRAAAGLRVAATTQFLATFFFLPWAYWRFGGEGWFWWAALILWLLMAKGVIDLWLLHRRFYPALTAERWQHAILGLIFPHYGLRGIDLLSKGFLAGSHPLAIASALASPDDAARFAHRILRDTRHPIPLAVPDSPASTTAEYFRSHHFQPHIAALIHKTPPDPDTPAPITCPRCATEYSTEGLLCRDCGHLATAPGCQKSEVRDRYR